MVLKTLRVTFAACGAPARSDQRVFVSLTPAKRRMAEGLGVPARLGCEMAFVARVLLLVTAKALLSIFVGRQTMSGRDEFSRMSPRRGTLVTGRAVVGLPTRGTLDRRVRPTIRKRSRHGNNADGRKPSYDKVAAHRLAPKSIHRTNVRSSSLESGFSSGWGVWPLSSRSACNSLPWSFSIR